MTLSLEVSVGRPVGSFKHERDCYPPGINGRGLREWAGINASGMKVSSFISFLLTAHKVYHGL